MISVGMSDESDVDEKLAPENDADSDSLPADVLGVTRVSY